MVLVWLLLFALIGMISPMVRFLGYCFVVLRQKNQPTSGGLVFLRRLLDVVTMVGLPVLYLLGFGPQQDELSLFSGTEKYLWWTWIFLYVLVYLGLSELKRIPALSWEVAWNTVLGSGVFINLLVILDLAIRNGGMEANLTIGNVPIILLLLMLLHKRHRLFLRERNGGDALESSSELGLLDDQLLPHAGRTIDEAKFAPGFSLVILELPAWQKIGLFLATGTLLVIAFALLGLVFGWDYALLSW